MTKTGCTIASKRSVRTYAVVSHNNHIDKPKLFHPFSKRSKGRSRSGPNIIASSNKATTTTIARITTNRFLFTQSKKELQN